MSNETRELYILMQAAESPFRLGRLEDHERNVARRTESWATDLVLDLVNRGYLTIGDMPDPSGGTRPYAGAEITQDGRKRIDELVKRGFKPERIEV
jgi:hypothetical protein